MMERDPTKRKVKPAAALFEFEDLGEESSDDSDFRIEDHADESDDDSIDSNDVGPISDVGEDADSASSTSDFGDATSDQKSNDCSVILSGESHNAKKFDPRDSLNILICSVCLSDRNDATNEIIECDNCGVMVHEGCYGVQDSDSVCSTDSPCPTTPWFCDSCKAGLDTPHCELCPNPGGIFKETDVGKWVHLVCALYMPGVAFAEVDKLQSVTLFEMAYSKWGAKSCSLCPDQRFARTGVCVGCDAGMCKTYFHVTCGQRAGLLAEAHSEEVDQADPFYAHCKLHTDKNLLKKRRRNWLAVQTKIAEAKRHAKKETEDFLRIQKRLGKSRNKYLNVKVGRIQPWVPTQKMGRLVTTSASACRALWRKAELSGVDTTGWTIRQSGADSLTDIHKRWHIQPAFNVEFIGYYLDRNVRIISMRKQLKEYTEENTKLLDEQSVIEKKRDEAVKKNREETERNRFLKSVLSVYYDVVRIVCPGRTLPNLDTMGRPTLHPPHFPSGVPTAAARKAIFSGAIAPSDTDLSDHSTGAEGVCLNNSCGLCRGRQDQHLLAKCDTCYRHYHLSCLNPPLTRMPKKTKLMGWQCSECDKDSSSSDVEVDAEAPRRLRNKDNGDSLDGSFLADSSAADVDTSSGNIVPPEGGVGGDLSIRGGKKRKREKHHRYSPDPNSIRDKSHRHKHKRSKLQAEQRHSLKICFKSIPHPGGSGSSYVATPSSSLSSPLPSSPPQFKSIPHPGGSGSSYVATPSSSLSSPLPSSPPQVGASASRVSLLKKKEEPQAIVCFTCTLPGESNNTVRCDECVHDFHFSCLDPPVKKSPKVRGYSWHCANCDPTESE